jgi:hypothetical protein
MLPSVLVTSAHPAYGGPKQSRADVGSAAEDGLQWHGASAAPPQITGGGVTAGVVVDTRGAAVVVTSA